MIPYNSNNKKNIHFNDPLTLLHALHHTKFDSLILTIFFFPLCSSLPFMYVHVLQQQQQLSLQASWPVAVYKIIEMNYSRKLVVLVLFWLISGQLIISPVEPSPVNTSLTAGEFLPIEPTEYRVIGKEGGDDLWRRRLAPFQLCLLCKCCAGAATTNCVTMPCCFGIDCQLPNKPYGVCAFVPKTCNCTSCAAV